MKIGFWELVVIVVVAFVFIGPDQLPVYAQKLGKMLRALKKYTGAASEEIQKNVVEPLNEIQAPLKEAVAPLTDIKKDIDNSVKDVTKSFTGIGKTSKEEAAKAEQAEEVTELEEVEELEDTAPAAKPEEKPAEAAPATETAEEKSAEEPKAEEKPTEAAPEAAPAEAAEPAAAPAAEEAAPAEEAKGLSCLCPVSLYFDAPAPAVAEYIGIRPPHGAAKVKRRFLLCVLVRTSCLSSWSLLC